MTDGSDIQEDSKIGEHVTLINTFLVYSYLVQLSEVCWLGGDFEILTDGSDIQEDSKIGEHVTLINTFLVYSYLDQLSVRYVDEEETLRS